MSYSVKEIYYTLQGEGVHAGRAGRVPALRGLQPVDGPRGGPQGLGACATFCDTDFAAPTARAAAGSHRSRTRPQAVARGVAAGATAAVRSSSAPGGEPLLQLDDRSSTALHERVFEVAVETNGTRPAPAGVDWICVSPKANADLVLRSGDELKLVFPQPGAEPERFADLDFRHFLLQPLDDDARAAHTTAAVRYCLEHPQWRLSLQTHKILGIA